MKKLTHRILAEGEQTGHMHEAQSATAVLYGNKNGEPVMLAAPDGSDVTHQEHNTVTLPAGDYDTRIVQEYDHAQEAARQVRD